MLTIEAIRFTDTMILNKGKFILVALTPVYQEEADKEVEPLRNGTSAIVALTGHQLEKIEVLITDSIACSPLNELELAEVSFTDFTGQYVFDDEIKDYTFKATASYLQLVHSP